MQGTKELPGVIPRVVDAMFARRSAVDVKNISLSMSYFEIHKEEVYDLLVNRAEVSFIRRINELVTYGHNLGS
jgi:kinesin family member 22